MAKITHTEIRMYRMGTGDCFVLKFYAGKKLSFKMMIDCGTWQGTQEYLAPFMEDLKAYVNNHLDLLVITHEHKDHVHLFDICKDQLTQEFAVDKTWMAWTENDKIKKVKDWQIEYGNKKKAMALAADRLQAAINDPLYKNSLLGESHGLAISDSRQSFANVISDFSALQLDKDAMGIYTGGLAGMKIVKETISKGHIEYYKPGDIIDNLAGLTGIKFYVLGPPEKWEEVKVETGGKGESYDHNKELVESDAFAAAVNAMGSGNLEMALPFDRIYEKSSSPADPAYATYSHALNSWRKIDNDWLNSAGTLALRINSITNNLSLVLAIEFEDSGRVMLFPGDAEYGSWASWHKINWTAKSRNPKVSLTVDLLNRTVFYKVAHHLSHHGTAERLGMEMMTNPDLSAMATLDYSVISTNWKNTMPNHTLLKALVAQTKGRFMVMNSNDLYYDTGNTEKLADKIENERKKMTQKEAKEFNAVYKENKFYLQYTVKG